MCFELEPKMVCKDTMRGREGLLAPASYMTSDEDRMRSNAIAHIEEPSREVGASNPC